VPETAGRTWRLLGAACALVTSACGVRSTVVDLYPGIAEQDGARIDDVRFVDTEPFRPDTLLTLIETQPSRCNFLGLPICVPFTRLGREEHFLAVGRVHRDVQMLERFYRIAGYFGTRVTPTVEEDGDGVDVTFTVDRGGAVVLDYVTVTGTEEVMDPDSLLERLPLRQGEIFHLGRFLESSDTVLSGLRRRGHAYAEVLRSFTVDTVDNRAEVEIEAVPGPRVEIDSIIIVGADRLGRRTTMRQLEFRQGELLRSTELVRSQRNLYGIELVSLASVTVAPDSLQLAPEDRTRATVLVSVIEARVNELEAAVGFGTVECLRTDAQWVNRSFGGGARRLSLRGSVSRLGVGEPFAIGAGERVCPAFRGDTTFGGTGFDYRLSADFTQPYFLTTRNQLQLNAFAERQSEPGIYQRQGVGGRAGLSRRMGLRATAGFGVDVEYGSTRASPALFCAAFLVCEPEVIDSLQSARLQTEFGVTYYHDHTDNRLDPSHGRVLRSALAWAPPGLMSDITYLRWTGDAALYRRAGRGRVLALALRAGNFFRTASLDPQDNFLPPEERFYAGGATSVRGFERNALGPGVYITDAIRETEDGDTVPEGDARFVSTGGTSLLIGSAELRMPSPFWSRLLRLVVFVDGGSVGAGSLWDFGTLDLKLTPGAGLRMQTPVGPVRMDIGYNPHGRETGPLLFTDLETGAIRRVNDRYRPPDPGFFGRLRVHLGVGHAF
jgi:outer membrane protein assembly factor BamA